MFSTDRPLSISEAALANLPEIKVNTLLADPPSLTKVNQAVPKMASGKTSGADSIPAEVFESGGPQLTAKLHELFLIMWEQEAIPPEMLQVPEAQVKVQVQVQVLKTSYQVQLKYTEYSKLSSPLWGFTSLIKILSPQRKRHQIYI